MAAASLLCSLAFSGCRQQPAAATSQETLSPAVTSTAEPDASSDASAAASTANPATASGLYRYKAQFLGVFDTVTTVVGLATDETTFTAYVNRLKDFLTDYHELYDSFNNYDGVSNIKTINDQAGIVPVTVSQPVLDLMRQCLRANSLSGGQVNMALGPVLEIWHDYREAGLDDPATAALPTQSELSAANQYTDINQVQIDWEAGTVYLPDAHMSLDVGSGAKGLACERAVEDLVSAGMSNVLLSLGGNVMAAGYRDGVSEPWKVGIKDPTDEDGQTYIKAVSVSGVSVVTSGVYERYYTVDGQRYHHIINPQTLFPDNRYLSVTIIDASSGEADSLTTALFNMSIEDGKQMLSKLDHAEALWVLNSGEVEYTDGFAAYLVS
ncbi:MAG: FAD:protein FMN transferase [Oscillospiraceae bacterium]|nr:FAD:protein FMN transferase [Oscillospiraceae bacterium]MDD4367526.1 FAD:protein FMN transferase [Oscillospiraceae bacterium]